MQPRHAVIGIAVLATLLAHDAHAGWMWDQNQDKIDDRIVEVENQGLAAAHVGGVLSGRLRFAVMKETAPFEYGVYIGYDHHPTDADVAALEALGVPVQRRYYSIDYVRSRVSFVQALQIAELPGVTRVETIPVMYAVNNVGTRTMRARDSGQELFPNVWQHLGIDGRGIVVGVLDSGVNDDVLGAYPGHESLRGKFVGGGDFQAGDATTNTALDASINPRHSVDPYGSYHGTHVAGTAVGSGGPQGMLDGGSPGEHAGLAPGARLVDCKVLTDEGHGLGTADGLDWCTYNRFNTWGLTGADSIWWGIDVINLSVGGGDASDGTDANCIAVNSAVRAGIVVCVASGNDGNTQYMPSPAAADLATTVGAFSDDNTIRHGDDIVADFSNEGPRLDDGDADHLDEMKPNVMGSGYGITSALGDPTTAGNEYHHINGTSMACPMVAGIAALVRCANPSLTALEVRDILQNTAEHRTDRGKQPANTADPFGVDPNYHPSWGWGAVDAYAAVIEALDRNTTQVARIAVTPQRGPDGIQVSWWSQREVGLARWQLDRAADVNGAPGAWSMIADLPITTAAPEIAGAPNRHPYSYTDLDLTLDPEATYWYRVRWLDGVSRSHATPPVRGRIADSPVIARVLFSWTHDYSDGDLLVRFGTGTNTASPVWWRQAPGRFSADSIKPRTGSPPAGTLQHYFHIDLTADDGIATFLPPSASNPWFLSVKEGGYLDTHGRVNDFAMQVFGPGGPTNYAALDTTTETLERQETVFWIPLNPALSVNHAPVLAPIGARRVSEGLPLVLTLSATDADGGALTYSASGLPAGASFDPGTRQFAWTPGHDDAGAWSVRFRVHDNALLAAADSEDVSITVADRTPGEDLAPVLDALTDRAVIANQRLSFRIGAIDPEGAAVTFASENLPAGATLDPATGAFEWTPGPSAIGIHPVTVSASDATGHSDSESFHLVVSAPSVQTSAPCDRVVETFNGVIGIGTDPGEKSIVYQSFVVAPNTNSIYGRLDWLGAPAVDLDFYLLDSDSTVIQSSAFVTSPELMVVGALPPGEYLWKIVAFTNPDEALAWQITSEACIPAAPLAVDDASPLRLAMAPAPNPFRARTAIHFALPSSGDTRLEVYDAAGRLVRTLQRGWLPAGRHVRVWDGRTESGSAASPGVYFSRIVTSAGRVAGKVVRVE